MCVCEREREGEREGDRQTDRQTETQTDRERDRKGSGGGGGRRERTSACQCMGETKKYIYKKKTESLVLQAKYIPNPFVL